MTSSPAPARRLVTPRLALRRLDAGDIDFVLALVNDPAWIANIGDRGIRDRQAALAWIADGPDAMFCTHGFGLMACEVRERGPTIGICGLIRRPGLDDVDLGYALLPVFRGTGYATEAALATLAGRAKSHGLGRVVAIVSPAQRGVAACPAALRLRLRARGALPGDDRPCSCTCAVARSQRAWERGGAVPCARTLGGARVATDRAQLRVRRAPHQRVASCGEVPPASTASPTNGLLARSSPKVDIGPCPGTKRTSSPSGHSRSTIERMQRRVVAAREVGAADRASEQHVADERDAARAALREHDVAGRVAGAVVHVERELADADRVALLEPAVRREGTRAGHPEHRRLARELLDPERVLALRSFDRHAGALRQLRHAAAVVDVAVRDEDLLERRRRCVRARRAADRPRRPDPRRRPGSWRGRRPASSSAGTA